MKKVALVFAGLLAVALVTGCSCYDQYPIDGRDGVDVGMALSAAPGCLAGGQTITTYVDVNRNAVLDSGDIVKQIGVICNGVSGTNGQDGSNGTNGTNGQDGTSVSVAVATFAQCPTGGVVVQSGLVSTSICNGAQGTMGPQGISGATGPQGIQGIQGPQGVAGANGADGAQGIQGVPGVQGPVGPQGPTGTVAGMTPTQLCPGDTASFKEFGFALNGQLYAVYFDNSQHIAFMSQLSSGSYVTTDGGNCYFSYSNDGTNLKLTSSSGTTTIPIH